MANTSAPAGEALDGADDASVLDLIALVAAARARGGSDMDHLPGRLSPSRASDFVQCPQLFYYKTICGITEPSTVQNARGTLAHGAFERIFDHPAGERTPDLAVSYLRPTWEEMTNTDLDETECPIDSKERDRQLARAADYLRLAPKGSDTEAEIFAFAERCVRNWFNIERVNNFSPTQVEMPAGTVVDGRELHVAAEMFGVTLHGFIDRLDRWVDARGNAHYSVSDYKTGKFAGEGKSYHPRTMERIRYESFFQLRIYALLCWEMFGIQVERLRLLYVKNESKDVAIKELVVTRQMMDSTKEEVRTIWKGITKAARTGQWETRTGPLCDYCFFNDICPAFNPEVAELPLVV